MMRAQSRKGRPILTRLRRQDGAGLILMIGVAAALAIMAATLVVVIANAQHNTYSVRMKTKSASVAEAALNVGMANLSGNWPLTLSAGNQIAWTATTPLPGAATATSFRTMFTSAEFPNPPSGAAAFSSVTYVDNQTTAVYNYDQNTDDEMYVIAQAGVGPAATRFRALVQLGYFSVPLPHGVALFTGANLLSNGGGNNPKIVMDPSSPPPAGTQASIRVVGTIDDTTVADQSKFAELTGAAAGSVDDVFPTKLLNTLTATAKAHGRYFSGANAINDALNSSAVPGWSSGGVSGLTVVQPTTAGTLSIKDEINTLDNPGILILLGGSNFDFGGGGDFWGVMYTEGTVDKGHGSFIIHGMLVAVSTVDMRGTVNISYNDDVISKLSSTYASSVRVVPNTWRELQPQ